MRFDHTTTAHTLSSWLAVHYCTFPVSAGVYIWTRHQRCVLQSDYGLSGETTVAERGQSMVNRFCVFQWCVMVTCNTLNATLLSLSLFRSPITVVLSTSTSAVHLHRLTFTGTTTLYLRCRTPETVNKSVKFNDLDIHGCYKHLLTR